jgi:hypothetical protein
MKPVTRDLILVRKGKDGIASFQNLREYIEAHPELATLTDWSVNEHYRLVATHFHQFFRGPVHEVSIDTFGIAQFLSLVKGLPKERYYSLVSVQDYLVSWEFVKQVLVELPNVICYMGVTHE